MACRSCRVSPHTASYMSFLGQPSAYSSPGRQKNPVSGFSQITGRDEAVHIVEDDLADAAVVGRNLIANPDLVRRWRDGLELNVPDQTTFYAPGAKGYTDYAFAE